MKVKLTIITVLFFSVISYSQLWSPVGAKWHHSFLGEFGQYSGYISTTYEKDTVINGDSCKQFRQLYNGITVYDTLFTKEIDSVVFIYNDQTAIFDTLFNFRSNIGASWKIPGFGFSGCGTDGQVVVENKGQRNINGFDLLWLKVNVFFDPINNNSL